MPALDNIRGVLPSVNNLDCSDRCNACAMMRFRQGSEYNGPSDFASLTDQYFNMNAAPILMPLLSCRNPLLLLSPRR